MKQQLDFHKSKVSQFLRDGSAPSFAIEDTCRVDNFGILKLPENFNRVAAQEWIGLVPAAGAASRYVAPLSKLAYAAQQKNTQLIREQIEELKKQGAESWSLPDFIKKIFRSASDLPLSELAEIAEYPKAFFPAVIEGQTFFEFKCIEHRKMQSIAAEVFVTPRGKSEKFKSLREKFSLESLPFEFFEQGDSLSTVRFTKNLEMLKDANGELSKVPAGHGAILKIFPEIKSKFPSSRFALIRNVDNIVGTSEIVLRDCSRFEGAVNLVYEMMSDIRSALRKKDISKAAKNAQDLANVFGLKFDSGNSSDLLTELMTKLFHTPQSLLKSQSLVDLYERPINVLGMVPNIGTDVGGTPCFVSLNGERVKLCLEVPHAAPKDKGRYLERADVATHFNPVWVAAELLSDVQRHYPEDHPFWLIAKKQYLNEEVYYFESLLYEILSCSLYANVLFFEIPRRLFNPHKALADAEGRKIKDWL